MAQNTFNVAVTGNAPFMEFDYNTSWLVRDALPNSMKRLGKKDIRIMKYARITHGTYEDVRRVSKEIWGGQRSLFLPEPQSGENDTTVDIDMILHLGMVALGWRTDQFRFEKLARRDGYKLPGDDGKYIDSEGLEKLGLPESIATIFDVKAAWVKVHQAFPDTPAVVSEDAGLYFCEFRMYSSLAEPLVSEGIQEKSGRVIFVHLPQAHDDGAISLARDITATYIAGLVDAFVEQNGE
ncbi:hypothetical protein HYALB_00006824 [Hymenoscyphus albidus]|uniref:Peptidase C15, pyroglutamyl peptidase I-like protein n=1 Tax=Hymenoscyphus albidus TaxID=595503 RepID=A0A9N9Q6J7_9HELO|nr:hypothetical protein HYALB_00006824 [Hymenoscyphus albidus]